VLFCQRTSTNFPPLPEVEATALAAGGSAAGGSAAVEVLGRAVILVSIPGAVSTSIFAEEVELNLVSDTWELNRVTGDTRVDVSPTDLPGPPTRPTAELDERELDEWPTEPPPWAKAGTPLMSMVAPARTIFQSRRFGMGLS